MFKNLYVDFIIIHISIRIIGQYQSTSTITAADLLNDTIAVATDSNQLFLLNGYDLIQPIASVTTSQPIASLRFFHCQPSITSPSPSPYRSQQSEKAQTRNLLSSPTNYINFSPFSPPKRPFSPIDQSAIEQNSPVIQPAPINQP